MYTSINQSGPKEELEASIKALRDEFLETLRKSTADLVNSLIGEEFMQFLEDVAAQKVNASRNGYYERHFDTAVGPITAKIPRARFANFQTSMMPPRQHRFEDLDSLIVSLYSKGLSESDLVQSLEEQYGVSVSRETIRKIVKRDLGKYIEFSRRSLPECPVVFLDATWVPLKRKRFAAAQKASGECIMVACGIDRNCRKQVLSFRIMPSEGAGNWKEFLEELRSRGVGIPRVIVTDGLNGMTEAIAEVFPMAKHQRCLVHIARNIHRKVRRSDSKEILSEFREVYSQKSLAEAEKRLGLFVAKWGVTYPSLNALLEIKDNLLAFYSFPKGLWKHIYTSNTIEAFNSYAKREFRKRIQMNSVDFCQEMMAVVALDYNKACATGRCRLGETLTDEEKKAMGFAVSSL